MAKSRRGIPTGSQTWAKPDSDSGSSTQRFMSQAIDWGLGGVIFLAPLVMGGRHPVGRLVFVALVTLIAIAWVVRQSVSTAASWRWSGAEWLILAGAVLISIQLLPLPPAVLGTLSPHQSELLPAWTVQSDTSAGFGSWSSISLTPTETTGGLVMFVAYGVLFLMVVQRIGRLEDVERLLRWIALAATGMAALGIAQRFAGNGNFLWLYEHPFRDTNEAVKGAFINENHFAHFLALGIAPLLWWLRSSYGAAESSKDRPPHLAVGLALALVAVAGLLTFSRGGVIVMFLAATVCVAIYARAGLLKRNALAALAAVGVFVGVALLIHGYAPLSDELASLGAGSVDDVDRYGIRRQLWSADLAAASQFPMLGTGVGSHAQIYPAYFQNHYEFEYTHTENGYLQVLLETGTAGLLLLLAGIATCCRWCFGALRQASSPRLVAISAVIVVALTVSLVHSVWDFVWHLPACMSLTVVLMACGCRLHQMIAAERNADHREPAGFELSSLQWATVAVAVVLLSALMLQDRLAPALAAPHWDRYLRLSVALGEQEQPAAVDQSLDALIDSLQQTIDRNPRDARAQARIANLLVRQFETQQAAAVNSVSLENLRQAALSSHFGSRRAQDAWLSVAVGDSRNLLYKALGHTRRGLKLCPLQGESYCDLAKLTFLEGRGRSATQAHLEQALLVRPYSADVLFAAGTQAARSGDTAVALGHWKAPFNRDAAHRQRIVGLLGAAIPPAGFIEHFDPDTDALGDLFDYYRQQGREAEAAELGQRYAERLEESAASETANQAARQWLEAYEVYKFLNDRDAALRCISKAVQSAPDAYQPRLKLAVQLLENEQYPEALRELNWCQRRKPQDPVVRNCLQRARVSQLRQAKNSNDTNHTRK